MLYPCETVGTVSDKKNGGEGHVAWEMVWGVEEWEFLASLFEGGPDGPINGAERPQ